MIESVLELFNQSIQAVVNWFGQIMDSTGAGKLYIAMMSVVLSVGILLTPLLGAARGRLDAGSDRAAAWIKDYREGRKHSTEGVRKRLK